MPATRDRRPHLDAAEGRRVLRARAAARGGVLYRPELARLGVPRWLVQAELRAGRWQRTGRQTVVTHNGDLTPAQVRCVAVLEVGPRAALDGVSGLQHRGVTLTDDGRIHVIAPKGSTPRRPKGVRVHESRRFVEADVEVHDGVRVVRPPVAAVHAALWARTDREALLFPIVTVQQRKATVDELSAAVDAVQRSARKRLLLQVVQDLAHGVRALGELDLARALRSRGLPEPDRQVLRRRATGQQYLDCRFDRYALTVEVDGVQHEDPDHRLSDVVRDLHLIAEGDDVVRIPLVALRLDTDQVLDGLVRVFSSRGWRRVA